MEQHIKNLVIDLCQFATGVVADDNEKLFARIEKELPLRLHRFQSGDSYNGWSVPQNWRVKKAIIKHHGTVVFDGTSHTLGVARYSRSFHGTLSWEELQPHLVTDSNLPDAYIFHCMWQYRPWAADWAFSVPNHIYKNLGPGEYEVDLETEYSPGEMVVAEHNKQGRSDQTIVFHSNSCHPHMANDGFAGTALLIALFRWLAGKDTYYSYRLIIGPEHVGTVFYLRDLGQVELNRIECGVFEEMPGTMGPIKVAATFLGNHILDRALGHAVQHHATSYALVPWRQGAGNDETVWEAPGYEIPFIEVTRSEELMQPYREYHTSLDGPELMNYEKIEELLFVLKQTIGILEGNSKIYRKFDGLICLSNPKYDLYMERKDPAINKNLPEDSEKWGYLLDCILRYFDGSVTILDIAEKHDLSFERVQEYVNRFEEKGLVEIQFVPMNRNPSKQYEAMLNDRNRGLMQQ